MLKFYLGFVEGLRALKPSTKNKKKFFKKKVENFFSKLFYKKKVVKILPGFCTAFEGPQMPYKNRNNMNLYIISIMLKAAK